MSSTSRVSALRTAVRRAALPRQPWAGRVPRRYSSAAEPGPVAKTAEQTSDLPWALGAVTVTALGSAYLLSPSKPGEAKEHAKHDLAVHEPQLIEGEDSGPNKGEGEAEREAERGDVQPGSHTPVNQYPEHGDPDAEHRSQETGQMVPDPPMDALSYAERAEKGGRKAKEEYEELIRSKHTKDAKMKNDFADLPSKKKSAEDPTEDPLHDRGAGVNLEAKKKK
ncbi:hypothetical protein F4780DRAFT_61259 [Xylariomycetidae sp. FL0641]|nr:hypothetical protein F4780DRAFT_61259 [Xylariomycetidae sp. FL0641]